MKIFGNVQFNQNYVEQMSIKLDSDFPASASVGQLVFKNSGLYICTNVTNGVSSWVPLVNQITSHTHVQTQGSAVWTISHSLNTVSIMTTVYDSNDEIIVPDAVEIVDASTVKVYLASSASGRAVLLSGSIEGIAPSATPSPSPSPSPAPTPSPSPAPSPAPSGSGKFWRMKNLNGLNNYLEVAEIQFYSGSTLLSGTMTSSIPPIASPTYQTALLNDGDVNTRAFWAVADVQTPNFWIQMEFSTAQAVNGMRIYGFDNAGRYPAGFTLEYSSDGTTWTTKNTLTGLSMASNSGVTFAV